jgi:hypothetical protein
MSYAGKQGVMMDRLRSRPKAPRLEGLKSCPGLQLPGMDPLHCGRPISATKILCNGCAEFLRAKAKTDARQQGDAANNDGSQSVLAEAA